MLQLARRLSQVLSFQVLLQLSNLKSRPVNGDICATDRLNRGADVAQFCIASVRIRLKFEVRH